MAYHRSSRKRRRRRLPEVLSFEEQEALLDVPNPKAPTGLRNMCMMLLMLDAGLRVSEIVGKEKSDRLEGGIRERHIDWKTGRVRIEDGKGHMDRYVWLNDAALKQVRRWYELHPYNHAGLLFTTLDGGKLSNRYIRELVKRCGRKAGLDRDIHPHLLRHTFATDIYRKTLNIRLVQKALGHADLSTTMIYTQIVDKELEYEMRNLRKEDEELPDID
jgi:integrase/recombinase XerD